MTIPAHAHLMTGPVARRVVLLVALLLTVAATPLALASDKGDHERARAAVKAGEVLPLRTVLDRLERTHPGQVLELELERDDGRWIYEVKLLQTGGRLVKLKVDARSAEVLRVKPQDERKTDRPTERPPERERPLDDAH